MLQFLPTEFHMVRITYQLISYQLYFHNYTYTIYTYNKSLDKQQKGTLYGGAIKRPGRPEHDYP